MQGGLRSFAIAWIVLLAPLLMPAGLKLGMAMTAATVALDGLGPAWPAAEAVAPRWHAGTLIYVVFAAAQTPVAVSA